MNHSIRYRAIHEAAHAVAGLVYGFTLERVSIHPCRGGGPAGHTTLARPDVIDSPDAQNWHLMACAVVDLAGHAATRQLGYSESPEQAGSGEDYRKTVSALRSLAGSDDIAPMMDQAMQSAGALVEAAWPAIEAIADELEQAHELRGDQVLGIVGRLDALGRG